MENFKKEDIIVANQTIAKIGLGKFRMKTLKTKNAESAFFLGLSFFYGSEAQQDFFIASEWFEKSAEWGRSEGWYGVGLCAARLENYDLAATAFQEGIKSGYFRCAIGLANLQELEIPDSLWKKWRKFHLKDALANYELAITNGIWEASYYKAILLCERFNKIDEAFQIFQKIHEDHPEFLSNTYWYASLLETRDLNKALEIHLMLAEKGVRESQHISAVAIYDGKAPGTTEDVMSLLRRACAQNYHPSQSFIAMLYDIGYGQPEHMKDSPELLEKSYTWIRRAIKNGSQQKSFALRLKNKMLKLGLEEPEDNDDKFFEEHQKIFADLLHKPNNYIRRSTLND